MKINTKQIIAPHHQKIYFFFFAVDFCVFKITKHNQISFFVIIFGAIWIIYFWLFLFINFIIVTFGKFNDDADLFDFIWNNCFVYGLKL